MGFIDLKYLTLVLEMIVKYKQNGDVLNWLI